MAAEKHETTAAEEVVIPESKPEHKAPLPSPPTPDAEETKNLSVETVPETVQSKKNAVPTILSSVSFKEESNLVSDLRPPEKKALDELKQLIQAALTNNDFNAPPPKPDEPKTEETPKTEEPANVKPTAATTPAEIPLKAEESSKVVSQEEKAVIFDEDGTKTVEAIEETVVPVSHSPPTAVEVSPLPETDVAAPPPAPEQEVFLWGVRLLGDEKSDTILLKFLRARGFKVKETLAMMKSAVIWRKEFGIESLVEEGLAMSELEKVVFYQGEDKEGHPVCYNVYGEFQNRELYDKAFGDEDKREKFLRWRILLLENGIKKKLDFNPGKVCTMVQVTDLKNVSLPEKKELRQVTKKALALLQKNYPEFVAKQVFVNVPWWYIVYHKLMSPFFSQRTRSKFVLAGPSKTTETLLKYISPEHVPVQYGGLGKANDPDFNTDAVTEITINPLSKHIIELPATEPCLVVWELRVLAWDVSYVAEFVPSAQDEYTLIAQKVRKFIPTDEPYVKNSFRVGKPGKIVLTIDNTTNKKKKLLYRWKKTASTEST